MEALVNDFSRILAINHIITKNAQLTLHNKGMGFRDRPVHINAKTITGRNYGLSFIEASQVPDQSIRCLTRLQHSLTQNLEQAQLVDTLAKFYFEFIFIIHPFRDGNGRTATYILDQVLECYGLMIPSYFYLRNFSLTGDMKTDFVNLKAILHRSIHFSSQSTG